MIGLERVSKRFGSGVSAVEALRDVSLSVPAGEICGIIGHSGAGKSTLIRLLNGLERPDSGRVEVAGFDISATPEAGLRQARLRIGMIFQHFNLLWSRTVRGNIALPLQIAGVPKERIRARTDELIRLVGLAGREEAYPAQLSGGQKQRVGIARALANQPSVLLCDEATSALDPETTDQILDLLARINAELGLTIVLITHEMHVVQRICRQVAVMDAGRIVETGPVAEVFANPAEAVTRRFLGQTAKAGATLVLTYPEGHPGDAALAGAIAASGAGVTILSASQTPGAGTQLSLALIGSDPQQAALIAALRAAGLTVGETGSAKGEQADA